MKNKKMILIGSLGLGAGIFSGFHLMKNNKSKQMNKDHLYVKDILPYLRMPAEVRRINEREPLFNMFLKKEDFIQQYLKNEDRIIKQNDLPSNVYLVKGDSYKDDLKEILNTKIAMINAQKDNEQMIEIIIL